jgi:hypothetical protein
MTQQTTFEAVAAALLPYSDAFVSWSFEYPGYIALRTDGGGVWHIGTANGTWGADLFIDENDSIAGESPDHSIDTGIDADEPDSARIAAGFVRADERRSHRPMPRVCAFIWSELHRAV